GIRLGLRACLEPLLVVPPMLRRVHDRRGVRRHLGGERERVGLQLHRPVRLDDLELVALTRLGPLDDGLPDAGLAEVPHRARLPVVEVADHRDGASVRRPDRERDTALAPVRAEHVVEPLVPSLAREVEVDLPEDAHTAARSSSRTIPATGIGTHEGRLSSSYRSSYTAFSSSNTASSRSNDEPDGM